MDRLSAANELAFRIGFSGHSGHLRLEPLPPVESPNPLKSIPDFVLPPATPEETPHSVKKYLEEKYLEPRLDDEEFSAENCGRHWEFDWFGKAHVPLEPSAPRAIVVPAYELPFRRKKNPSGIWEPASVETDVAELFAGAQDSGSTLRMPAPAKDFVRGSANNRPFRPGGLDDSQSERIFPEGAQNGDWVREILDGGLAQSIPPTFKKGLDLGYLKGLSCHQNLADNHRHNVESTVEENLSKFSVQFDDLFKKAWEEDMVVDKDDHGIADETVGKDDSGYVDVAIEAMPGKEEEEAYNINDLPNSESTTLDEILQEEPSQVTSLLKENQSSKQQEGEIWALKGGNADIANHFHELIPDMALDFPFELDNFQKEAIYYLERGDSVFIAAHTSAGKTVVAEYAFALASKHCTRAVYTAPIKTISNQKYRDFCGKFDVGLLTGDVTLKPESSCLIMTTEILRSMLYKGADIIRDIEWVIFDEVHYVNDAERGVVWEEVIIMLPRHVNVILLSATVPNTLEFAAWIGRTKQKQIRVIATSKRPVPLEHCLFYSGELYTICERENFLHEGLQAAKKAYKIKNSNTYDGNAWKKMTTPSQSSMQNRQSPQLGMQNKQREISNRGKSQKHYGSHSMNTFSGPSGAQHNNWGMNRSEASLWLLLIHKLQKKSLLPVVIFCLSKNRCDKSVDNLTSIDLTTTSEKSIIRLFCDKAFSRLKGTDRNLPQVVRVTNLLRRGIGVHHAGLLPIVKEVVEMLFCRGVIKVLFSTETFAMGVNAPARTVVFDTLRKFDGKNFRQLLPGEYIQMAGRAGRRGLDKIGTVIVMCRDEIPEESDLKHITTGKPTKLESQFRLTYTMILHLLNVEDLKVEDMLKRSFAEYHSQQKLPKQKELLLLMQSKPSSAVECIKGEPSIEEYYEMFSKSEVYKDAISAVITQSGAAHKFLSPGRIVVIRSDMAEDHLLGVILKALTPNKKYIALVLTTDMTSSMPVPSNSLQTKGTANSEQGYYIAPKGKRGMDDEYYSSAGYRRATGAVNIKLPYHGSAAGVNYKVIEVENKDILSICNRKIKVDQVRLLEDVNNTAYSKTVQELLDEKRISGSKYPPALDAIKDLKLNDMDVVEKYHSYHKLLQSMAENKCHGCIKLKEQLEWAKEQRKHKEELNELKYQLSDEALQLLPDFQGRIDVLKELQCIDSDLDVQIKGRVACEMNSGEELICTECLFDNQLDDLEPEEAVALMSAFVFQQKNTSLPTLTSKLALARTRLYDTAVRIGNIQAHYNLPIDPEEYARANLKFGLVEVVYEWAKGTAFADICELTDVPEGLIVRTIVRLDETCREFRNAADIMGNSALRQKMEAASNAIKRDIVFAASLYVTGVDV